MMNKQRHFYFEIKQNCCRAATRREGVTGARDPARRSRSRPCVKQGEDPECGRREGTGTERPGQLPAARLPPGTFPGPQRPLSADGARRRAARGGARPTAPNPGRPRDHPGHDPEAARDTDSEPATRCPRRPRTSRTARARAPRSRGRVRTGTETPAPRAARPGAPRPPRGREASRPEARGRPVHAAGRHDREGRGQSPRSWEGRRGRGGGGRAGRERPAQR